MPWEQAQHCQAHVPLARSRACNGQRQLPVPHMLNPTSKSILSLPHCCGSRHQTSASQSKFYLLGQERQNRGMLRLLQFVATGTRQAAPDQSLCSPERLWAALIAASQSALPPLSAGHLRSGDQPDHGQSGAGRPQQHPGVRAWQLSRWCPCSPWGCRPGRGGAGKAASHSCGCWGCSLCCCSPYRWVPHGCNMLWTLPAGAFWSSVSSCDSRPLHTPTQAFRPTYQTLLLDNFLSCADTAAGPSQLPPAGSKRRFADLMGGEQPPAGFPAAPLRGTSQIANGQAAKRTMADLMGEEATFLSVPSSSSTAAGVSKSPAMPASQVAEPTLAAESSAKPAEAALPAFLQPAAIAKVYGTASNNRNCM